MVVCEVLSQTVNRIDEIDYYQAILKIIFFLYNSDVLRHFKKTFVSLEVYALMVYKILPGFLIINIDIYVFISVIFRLLISNFQINNSGSEREPSFVKLNLTFLHKRLIL